MSVYGYLRFSYFGRSDARLSRNEMTLEDRYAVLYARDRMETRFHLFENICLPSLRFQTDTDFKIMVLASQVMPEEYKRRLAALVADIPQIELVYSDAERVHLAFNPWQADQTAGNTENTVHFRLDDDDALSSDMIAILRGRAEHAQMGEMLSYPNGLYLAAQDGVAYLTRKFEPYNAVGMAFVNRPGEIRTPYDCDHTGHFRNVPSSLDPRPLAYLYTAHPMSDTHRAQKRQIRRAIDEDPEYDSERGQRKIRRALRRNFPGFKPDRLKEIILHTTAIQTDEPAPVYPGDPTAGQTAAE